MTRMYQGKLDPHFLSIPFTMSKSSFVMFKDEVMILKEAELSIIYFIQIHLLLKDFFFGCPIPGIDTIHFMTSLNYLAYDFYKQQCSGNFVFVFRVPFDRFTETQIHTEQMPEGTAAAAFRSDIPLLVVPQQ
jgi:hypothetical protein